MKQTFTTPAGSVHNLYLDMLDQPHIMIAGATGSGKSVAINGMISTALYSLPLDRPGGKAFILIDPKRVELVQVRTVPHTLLYASEPADMIAALNTAMQLTETRYRRMQAAGIRKYDGSDVYIIIDEFADLMTTDRKHVQPLVQRLAQIGRAARVHIVLATQTPIAKVIPTEIKCNFDSRLGLRARSAQDSRNIIGKAGLESLDRYGTGYYMTPAQESFVKVPLVSDQELTELVQYWTRQKQPKILAAVKNIVYNNNVRRYNKMTINTHGLKMSGLKKASGATVNWTVQSGGHTQISYDMDTGDVLTADHIGQSWTVYHDASVIPVCHTSVHMTMQQIADAIADAVADRKANM